VGTAALDRRCNVGRVAKKSDPAKLEALAAKIREAFARMQEGLGSAVKDGIVLGELLIEAKDEIGHGGFMAWRAEHFPFTHQWANTLMLLARNKDRPEIESADSIRAVKAMLAAPQDEDDLLNELAGRPPYIFEEEDEDELTVTDPGPISADYNDTEEDRARRDKTALYESGESQPMVEMFLLVTPEEREEVIAQIGTLRRAWGSDLSATKTIQRALKEAVERVTIVH
jgi:hypothetical protein